MLKEHSNIILSKINKLGLEFRRPLDAIDAVIILCVDKSYLQTKSYYSIKC